jgi:hypothetical protein
MSRIPKTIVWLLATGSCMAVIAAPAQARRAQPQRERVTGGQLAFAPSAAITSLLQSHAITATPIAPASVVGGSFTMPIASGHLQMPAMRGSITAQGVLQYTNGKKNLRIHGFTLTRSRHRTTLSAVVNGHRIKVAKVVGTTVTVSGATGTITGVLELSRFSAHRINHLVGKHVVSTGEEIGTLSATVTMA